jgi:ubiquinone/menaquinone biosynthesis C-methylase UbiE
MATTDYAPAVSAHYSPRALGDAILDALRAAGKNVDALTPDDLAPYDQLHAGRQEATIRLGRLAELEPGQQVLDVGSGLGGPARTIAAEFGCRVTGLDLTEAFCRVAEMLTARTGQSGQVTFRHGNALELPFEENSFDVVWMHNSGMNIPDKERLYAAVHRVLRPGGRLALTEVMAGATEPLHFPVPWASEPAISFVRPAEAMRALIAEREFRELAWIDVTPRLIAWQEQQRAAAAAGAPPFSLGGAALALAQQGLARNFAEGRAVGIEAVFERR